MKEYRYHVTLETFFGNKTGTMVFGIEDNAVKGVLDIMQHENPFQGHILKETCHITGNLKSLIHTLSYEAEGTVNEKEISFVLVTNQHSFRLTGVVENE